MLPRSLFSESTLKTGPVADSSDDVGSDDDLVNDMSWPEADTRRDSSDNSRHVYQENKKRRMNHREKPRRKSIPASSSSSSSSTGSDSSDVEDAGYSRSRQQHHLHQLHNLQLKLQRQYAKQAKYIEKTRNLHKNLEKTSRQIERLMGHITEKDQHWDEPMKNVSKDASDNDPICSSPHSHGYTGLAGRDLKLQTARRGGATASSSNRRLSIGSDAISLKQTQSPPSLPGNNLDFSATANLAKKTLLDSRTPRSTKIDGSVHLASKDDCDLYLMRYQEVDSKGLAKKPRSLLLNIANESTDTSLRNLIITTTLAGDMQFWDSTTRRNTNTFHKKQLYQGWIEDLCWATPTMLALCPCRTKKEDGGPISNESVLLVHVKPGGNGGRVQKLKTRPHDGRKDFSTIAPIDLGQIDVSGSERASFVTGGTDRMVYLWQMQRDSGSDDFELKGTTRLNIDHTSSVQALCYNKHNNRLFSGGADYRLICLDFQTQRSVIDYKFQSRVNHIQQNLATPNLLLLSLSQKQDQLVIYDQRSRGFAAIQLEFGYTEADNMSRYVRPDWHQNGHMVVCGNDTKVHFWDLRYANVQRGPCFSFETQAKSRVLRTVFLPGKDTLLSVSSTRTMTWTDYNVQANSRFHSFSGN